MKKILAMFLFLLFLIGAGCNKKENKLLIKENEVIIPVITTEQPPITGKVLEDKMVYDENKDFQIGKDEHFGTITVLGYVEIKKGMFDCSEGCEESDPSLLKVDVVQFNVISSTSKLFDEFLKGYDGNAFAGRGWFNLGCLTEDKNGIQSYNAGDSGFVDNLIQGEDFVRLLKSDQKNPVKLQLTKAYSTGGMGASTCYSHFRNFKVK